MDGYKKLASKAASGLRDHLYLGIQLTGLVYLCSSAYFLSLSLERLLSPGGRKELTKITFRAACLYLAAGKNEIKTGEESSAL